MTTERWAAARTSAALRIVAGAVAAMLLVASCSGSPSAQHRRASSKAAAVSVYRALGSGTLYLLSGDPALGQVLEMQVRARKTRGLTSGMSWISASSRGLVLADDRSGEGVFAVYHDGRVIDQPAGHVVTAAINDTGAVAYAEIPYSGGPWRLIVQPPESGHGTLLYRQALDIGDFVWGPDHQLAMVSGITNGTPAVIVLSSAGKVEANLTAGLAGGITIAWGVRAPGIAVGEYNRNTDTFVRGQFFRLSGTHQPLPAGWAPGCWNPAGTRLLMFANDGTRWGLWNPSEPAVVDDLHVSTQRIVQCVWLAKPAAGA